MLDGDVKYGSLGPGGGYDGWNFQPFVKRVMCGKVCKYKLYSHRSKGGGAVEDFSTVYLDGYYIDEDGVLTDGEFYLSADGTVRRRKESQTKADCLESVRKSFARLRDIINCNVVAPERVLFVTYTYDPKKLKRGLTLDKVSKDMQNCHARWRAAGHDIEYVYTIEQQGNGRWHMHELLFFPDRAPYVPQMDLERFWPHGWVRISKRFDEGEEIENIGAYVCADMTFGESGDEHGREKAERLLNYPAGAHLYRCSRGVKRPEVEDITVHDYFRDVNALGDPYYTQEKLRKFNESPDSWRWYRYEHYALDDWVRPHDAPPDDLGVEDGEDLPYLEDL